MNKTNVSLMGVTFSHLTMLGAMGVVAERIALRQYMKPLTVFTPNTEQLMQAKQDNAFLAALNSADVTVPDTVGVVRGDWWRAAMTGKPWLIRERVAGIDLAENLVAEATKQGWKVAIVGGMDSVAATAVDNLKKRFSGLQIWWVPMGAITEIRDKRNEIGLVEDEVTRAAIQKVNDVCPDIVFVGLGAPKQEWWVLNHQRELTTQVVMVVGGAIDMWAGKVKRAPKWVRQIGMEWWWRLMQEPWRIKRQWRLVGYVGDVLRGKI